MKLINLVLFAIILNIQIFGGNYFLNPTVRNNLSFQNEKSIFSGKPTAQEFADVFYLTETGYHDPYDVLREIETIGDVCTKELDKLIFSDKIKPNPPNLVGIDGEKIDVKTLKLETKKEYALLALERIGSVKAFDVVLDVIKKHDDIEIIAMAMNIINVEYREKVIRDEIEPDKHFLKYFVDYLEDLTYVNAYNIKLDKICRNGLKIWLGKDYGDYVEESDIKDEENAPHKKLTKDEKDKWWEDNSPKIKWNKDKNKFEIK